VLAIQENDPLFKSIISRIFHSIGALPSDCIITNIAYSGNKGGNVQYPGLQHVTKLRTAGDKSPVICYGFVNKERLFRAPEASVLRSDGIFYLQLPCTIQKMQKLREVILGSEINASLDAGTTLVEYCKHIRLLIHNLNNVIGTIEPNINGLKTANENSIQTEWKIIRKAILSAGPERIKKEIQLGETLTKLAGKGSKKDIALVTRQLGKINTLYKKLFDLVAKEERFTKLQIKNVIKNGESIIPIIYTIKINLERIMNNDQKV